MKEKDVFIIQFSLWVDAHCIQQSMKSFSSFSTSTHFKIGLSKYMSFIISNKCFLLTRAAN